MLDTLTRYLSGIGALNDRKAVRAGLEPIYNLEANMPLTSAGLVVSGTGTGVTAKIGAADFYALANNTLVKVAAGTDMAALVGTITAAKFNVFVFYVDAAGNLTSQMGTEGATIAALKFPPAPPPSAGKAIIGFILVTYASTFTGGTTPLATATTVYVSSSTSFDTSIAI